MKDFSLMLEFIKNKNNYWFIALDNDKIIGSIIYRYDKENLLGKVYGAVISPKYRGNGLTQDIMNFGYDYIQKNTKGSKPSCL